MKFLAAYTAITFIMVCFLFGRSICDAIVTYPDIMARLVRIEAALNSSKKP